MLIPDIHLQLPYPGWQRADSTSRWALAILAAQQHWDPVSNPWVWSPAQGGAQGSLLTGSRSQGHGEMGSKWGRQTLTEGVWLSVHVKVWDRILQSQTRLVSPKTGISGRTDWESTENTVRNTSYLRNSHSWLFFPLPPLLGILGQQEASEGVSRKWKTCCLMLRVNTAPSCVPTTHTGRTSPCGTDSSLSRAVSGGTQDSQLWHRIQHRHFPTLSLASHYPPGETSCTQQQGAPQLTWNPFHCLFSSTAEQEG